MNELNFDILIYLFPCLIELIPIKSLSQSLEQRGLQASNFGQTLWTIYQSNVEFVILYRPFFNIYVYRLFLLHLIYRLLDTTYLGFNIKCFKCKFSHHVFPRTLNTTFLPSKRHGGVNEYIQFINNIIYTYMEYI